MYANYLVDVVKLVFIVGDTQNTTHVKNLLQNTSNNREKIFYKCLQQLPAGTFQKQPPPNDKKGIIRKQWFHKILHKNPEMIIMVFNCTLELSSNEVWQDRLKIILKKINKVYDTMKFNNKQQVRLRILIFISNKTFGGVNLPEKFTNFLKIYEKDLIILQKQRQAKDFKEVRSQWMFALQKNYDNKYKKIMKRYQESFLDRKLGCLVKMAILSEMLNKKDEKEKYVETYKALRHKFREAITIVTILNHNQIRELRAVSDIVFLRYLKILIRMSAPSETLFKQTLDHMEFFKLKNLGLNETHKYYYYEELLWRCNLIENFFQILYSKELMETLPTVSLCELLNELVTYLYALSITSEDLFNQLQSYGSQQKQEETEDSYIGLISYKKSQLLQTDVIYSFIKKIISHKKDYLAKGIQLINRYKNMDLFKKNQLLFLNVYLLRFYFKDGKLQGFLATYDQIMKQQLERSNYFLLNEIFNQIQEDFNSITEQQKVLFYGVSCLICDYFENSQELQKHLDHLIKCIKTTQNKISDRKSLNLLDSQQKISQNQSQLNQPYKYSLKKNSHIASISCYMSDEFVYIQNELQIKFQIILNPIILKEGCQIQFNFNHENMQRKINIAPSASNEVSNQYNLKFNLLDFFHKDQTVKIEFIKIYANQNLQFIITKNHINFEKYKENKVYSNIRCPEIQIYSPYDTYYINEVTKFQVTIEKLAEFSVEAKLSIKQEDPEGKTEVFINFEQRMNVVNSNYMQQILSKNTNINQFWLKCNKIGQKSIKLNFTFTIQKIINKNGDLLNDMIDESEMKQNKLYVLKQHFTVTKQLKFVIKNLFKINKRFMEFNNDDGKMLESKNIPVDKKIAVIFQLQSLQDVEIKQIGQHKNPKKIQYFKQISKKMFHLKKSNKIKLNMIFRISNEYIEQIELFLMSIYIKWKRTQAKLFIQPFENLFLDYQTKISCANTPLSIFLNVTNNFQLMKSFPSKLVLSLKSHSDKKSHILAQVEGTASILRIGEKTKQITLDPQSENKIEFDIFPIVSGFLPLPNIKVFVDGLQKKINIHSGQMIKCI